VASTPLARQMTLKQFEGFDVEPPSDLQALKEAPSIEPPATFQELNQTMDDIQEVPSKKFVRH
jgi:hypothetical protein